MERRRLEIGCATQGSVTVLTFAGDLDLGTLNPAKSRLQDEMLPDRRRFVLDLDQVGYIDSSGLGFLLYFRLLRRIGAVRSMSVAFLNPVVALISGALYLGETITLQTTIGAAVVLAGTALSLGLWPAAARPAASTSPTESP